MDVPAKFVIPSWEDAEANAKNYEALTSDQFSVRTRYFSFVVHETYYGVNTVAIAEFLARGDDGKFIDKTLWRIHDVSNEIASDPASNLLDNSAETVWHTSAIVPGGHYVVVDMGRVYDVGSIVYIPRQSVNYSSVIGRVKNYSLSIYSESSVWIQVKSGTFHPGRTAQDIVIKQGNERFDFALISREPHQVDLNVRRMSLARADFDPTGLFCKRGKKFYVYIEHEIPSGVEISILVGTYIFDEKEPARFSLVQGANEITPDRDGLLYIKIVHEAKKHLVSLSFRGVDTAPYYVLGKTTKEQWLSMLLSAAHVTAAQLFTGKAMIAVTVAKAKEWSGENIDRLLSEYNKIIDKADEVCGLNESSHGNGGIDLPSEGIYQFNQAGVDSIFMVAGHYALGFHTDVTGFILSVDKLAGQEGWGPWHELGHTYQMPLMNGRYTTESTNNIIALAIESMYGVRPDWIDQYGGRQEAELWLRNANRDFNTAGYMVSLVMYNELTERFGAGFYPSLYREYRRLSKESWFIEGTILPESRNDMFAYVASKCAKTNLINHFDYWGFKLHESTKARIRGLGYP